MKIQAKAALVWFEKAAFREKRFSAIIKTMNNVTKQVAKTIKEHALIERGDVVLLGLSGGPDSLCLLHVLNGLKAEFGFELRALHLNHKVRSDADSDAEWLHNHCSQMGVPLRVVTIDIPAIARNCGLSVEEAGRIERQKALFEEAGRIERQNPPSGEVTAAQAENAAANDFAAANSSCDEKQARVCSGAKIALAHNRDDQAETVLLRLLRGTGTHGLAAMEYKRADGLIRPLLDTSRKEIEAYCCENKLQPRIDSTNASTDYTRNKVRLELIPELEAQFNPNIKETLCRLAANAREDDAALLAAAEQWLTANAQDAASPAGTPWAAAAQIALPIKDLAALPPAIFKRVIVLAFGKIGLTQDIAAVHLNSLKQAADKNYGGKVIEFPHGYKAKIEKGFVILYR